MKIVWTSLAIFLLMAEGTEAVQIKNHIQYKSDEFDDLLEGVITNNHKTTNQVEKPQGAVDRIVEEALAQAKADEKQ